MRQTQFYFGNNNVVQLNVYNYNNILNVFKCDIDKIKNLKTDITNNIIISTIFSF